MDRDTDERFELISKIADRAIDILEGHLGIIPQKIDIFMDIDNVDKIIPLRLEAMAEDEGSADLIHDIAGIYRHFNRVTKQMEDCFVPRFAN